MNPKPPGFFERPLLQVLVVVILGVFCYSNTFQVPFVLDDPQQIGENPVIHDLANFFINSSGHEYLPNRFIGNLTFALNYHFGGLNVVGYHAVNLAIHIANALLVYCLAALTLRTPFFSGLGTGDWRLERQGLGTGDWGLKTKNSKLKSQNFLPFLAALLFVSHPIQTQAVTYIVQRLTSLATLFYLASLVLHVRWRLAREAVAAFSSRSVLPYYLLSLLMAVLAMKTKEIAFTLPLVVLLYEISFFGRLDVRKMALLAPLLLTICIIPLGMISLQQSAGDVLSEVSSATRDTQHLSRIEYLYTQFSVIVTYLRLLVLPVNQNLDYDFPLSHTLLEPRAFLSLLLLLAFLALAGYLYVRSRLGNRDNVSPSPQSPVPSPQLRLASFGIVWFFVTLSVESSLIPIRDVIFEHRVYLPSVGFFIAASAMAVSGIRVLGMRFPGFGRLAGLLLVVVICLLSVATWARNRMWRDWETLWHDVKVKSPAKTRAYNILGMYHAQRGDVAKAITEFMTAIRLKPRDADAWFNLGQAYTMAGRYHDAARSYRTVLRLNPRDEEVQQILKELEQKLSVPHNAN
jgi:tetratricopeptide (TPR) repeat protein